MPLKVKTIRIQVTLQNSSSDSKLSFQVDRTLVLAWASEPVEHQILPPFVTSSITIELIKTSQKEFICP